MLKRVLVVEDDLLNRMMFCAVLREGGYQVEEVADERMTLAEVEEHKARSAGASGYLAKPVSMKPFLEAVGGLIAA